MAAVIKATGAASAVPLVASTSTGTIETDATALSSTTVSLTAGADTSTAIGSTAGLLVGTYVDIAGAGASGASMRALLRGVTAGVSVRLAANPSTTVAGAALVPAVNVSCDGRPRYICLLNRTSLERHEWFEGMDYNTAIKTSPAGDVSLVAAAAITPHALGFWVSGAMLPVSSKFSWLAEL
jgi:hypothetical protein